MIIKQISYQETNKLIVIKNGKYFGAQREVWKNKTLVS